MARSKPWWIVRVALGVGGLIALLLFVNPTKVWNSLANVLIGYLVLAYFLQLLAKLVWTVRWRAILSIGGIQRNFWNVFALLHVGLFFNTFLPTGAGGDVVRGWYSSRGRDGRFAGYVSVLFERALGLITLALLAAVASAVEIMRSGRALSHALLIWVLVISTTIAAAGFALFMVGGRPPAGVDCWRRRTLPRLHDGLTRAVEAWRRPDSPRGLIFASSMALQVIAVLWYIATARAVDLDTPAVVFFLLMPAAAIVSMLPLTPGGMGIREWTLVGLLTAYGVPEDQAAAFALLALVVSTTFALIGALVYPFYRVPEEDIDSRTESLVSSGSRGTTPCDS
jgi:uncharacterized protein (TIRG00374 family)